MLKVKFKSLEVGLKVVFKGNTRSDVKFSSHSKQDNGQVLMIKVFNSSLSCLSLPEDEFSQAQLINNQLISFMYCFSAFKKSQIPTLSVALQ